MIHPSRRTVVSLLAAAAASAFTPVARAAEASPWTDGQQSRVRLLAGGSDAAGRTAGIEIALAPGFKTYWRNPGDSGLPPNFAWTGSQNVKDVEVLWPAPAAFDDGGGTSYGYEGGVVLPLRVTPQDPQRPVHLALSLDYGVCKDICIPEKAALTLDVAAGAPPDPRIAAALARVPARQPVGADGPLAVTAVAPTPDAAKPSLVVTVRAPQGAPPQLFVEGPDGWYFAPGSFRTAPDGTAGTFPVEIAERPAEAAGEVPLRLTLVAGDRAIESDLSLDARDLPR